MAKKFTPRKLDILGRIESHGSATSQELAKEMGIPLFYVSRYLRHYWGKGLLKRIPMVMEQGGIRYSYSLSESGKKTKTFLIKKTK